MFYYCITIETVSTHTNKKRIIYSTDMWKVVTKVVNVCIVYNPILFNLRKDSDSQGEFYFMDV